MLVRDLLIVLSEHVKLVSIFSLVDVVCSPVVLFVILRVFHSLFFII